MSPKGFEQLSWWKRAFAWWDKEREYRLGYHGPCLPPKEITGELWLKPALSICTEGTSAQKAAHYCQSQKEADEISGGVECVTTSAVIIRNIVKDQIADRLGRDPIPDLTVRDFVAASNKSGLAGWKERLPSSLPVVGGFMHPVLQLPNALDQMREELRQQYGCSFRCERTSGNTLDDLIENLRNDRPMLIHGIWPGALIDPVNGKFKFDLAVVLGGFPHTMPLVMYSSAKDKWWFYDLGWVSGKRGDGFYRMSTPELMDFWGRRYVFNTYTRPFSMTTITME